MKYISNFSSFIVALHSRDLDKANKINSYFSSGCSVDSDEVACAFHKVTNDNKHFKKLKAENFVNSNFNKKINLN